MDRLSAAHPTLPLPIYAQVTNLENGRTIVVRVNDRGPYANDRVIDLSRRSAELLGYLDKGTTTVRVQYLRRAPLNGDDSFERRYVASQPWMQVASNQKRGKLMSSPYTVGSLPDPTPPSLKPNSAVASAPATVRPVVTATSEEKSRRLLIQAGSFKSKANADKARADLAGLAPVEVATVEASGETYFRVRVGPFAGETEAAAALSRITEAGYAGARLVQN
jgi:rare lipoprotein A